MAVSNGLLQSGSAIGYSHCNRCPSGMDSPGTPLTLEFQSRSESLVCSSRRLSWSHSQGQGNPVNSTMSFYPGKNRNSPWGRASLRVQASATESPKEAKRIQGRGCRVVGTGSAVPSRLITNDFLSKIVDTNDEWIASRTGIRSRRVLAEGESITSLSVEACRKALEMANMDPLEVDLVLLCTSSPEDIFGGACMVQRDVGCRNAVAFDLTAACSGFVLGLVTASRFIQGGGFRNVLVIGADALSRYVDWTDRGTCILFGDGCGAVAIRVAAEGEEDGLLGFDMRSDGEGARHLHCKVGAVPAPNSPLAPTHPLPNGHPSALSSFPQANEDSAALAAVAVGTETESESEGDLLPARAQPNTLAMNGRDVYKFAVTSVPQVLQTSLDEAGLDASDIDWLLLHQANQRILDAVAQKFGVPFSKVLSNVSSYGNTSAASIPLALDEAVRDGKVKPGDVVAMAGFGAGLTWAGAVLRYG